MASENHYGKTQDEKAAEDSLRCRQIVQEILRFGVKQKQIPMIIKLLALELEDREAMQKIVDVLPKQTEEAVRQKLIT